MAVSIKMRVAVTMAVLASLLLLIGVLGLTGMAPTRMLSKPTIAPKKMPIPMSVTSLALLGRIGYPIK